MSMAVLRNPDLAGGDQEPKNFSALATKMNPSFNPLGLTLLRITGHYFKLSIRRVA
jgi:hypothetical protein